MNATEIWLVRHGQSAANAGLPTDDPAAIVLTTEGEAQARSLAAWLPEGDCAIWTSSYRRARDTAGPASTRLNRPLREHPMLHEFVMLDPTRCVGSTYEERIPWVKEYWHRNDPDFRDGVGSETFREFSDRVDCVRRDIQALLGRTLVYGHGMFFCLWIWRELGFSADTPTAMSAFRRFNLGLPMPNTGIYRLVRQQEAWQVRVHSGWLEHIAAGLRTKVIDP